MPQESKGCLPPRKMPQRQCEGETDIPHSASEKAEGGPADEHGRFFSRTFLPRVRGQCMSKLTGSERQENKNQ